MKKLCLLALFLFLFGVEEFAQKKDDGTPQQPLPSASISPGSLDFGNQVVKTASKPLRVTVTNTGGRKLYIHSVTLSGDHRGDFVVHHDTCTGAEIAAGKSCVVDVVFTPTVNERRQATVMLSDNAVDTPQKVEATGNGINSVDVPPRK